MSKKSVKVEEDCSDCDNGVDENGERCPTCNGCGWYYVYIQVEEED